MDDYRVLSGTASNQLVIKFAFAKEAVPTLTVRSSDDEARLSSSARGHLARSLS